MLLTALMAGWAMAFAYSFIRIAEMSFATPIDWQAARGPVLEFLRWQGVALLLAVASFGVSLSWPRGAAVRGLGVLPLALAALLAGAIGLVFALL